MAIDLELCVDGKQWDELVENSSYGTIFHTWDFLKIIEKHTPSKLYPILGLKGTNPIGLYPLFYQKKGFLKLVFSPPPHVAIPYMGPIFINFEKLKQNKKESLFNQFQKEVDAYISNDLNPSYIHILTIPDFIDSRPFLWLNYNVTPKYNYVIDLSHGLDFVWKNLKKKLRQNICKEDKKGVVIRKGTEKDMQEIYSLLSERYKDQDKNTRVNSDYLISLYSHFHPQNMKISVAEYEGEILGGLIDLYYKNKASSWIGNPKPKNTSIQSTDLLQWEAIKRSYNTGCSSYEEVGANTQRLCRYKSKFNPDLSINFSAKKTDLLASISEKTYNKLLR